MLSQIARTTISVSTPSPTDNERCWTQHIADVVGGVAFAATADGSVADIVTSDEAWEVEWVKRWQQSIGQALFYGAATNRQPVVCLLLRGKDTDRVYYLRCLAVCQAVGIRLETWSTRDGSRGWM